jgi:methionyl-tRNA formyltransferase
VAIGERETTPQLYERLCRVGAEALLETLDALETGTAVAKDQDHAHASRAPKLRKEEGAVDWTAPARTLFNRIRAFKPFPGTYCTMEGRRLGIEWAEPIDEGHSSTISPGTVVAVAGEWFDVACGEGILRVVEVKPAGRTAMSAADFMRGTLIREGMVLR